MKDSIPIGRWGTKAEIGHTVLFLASEAGSLVTGETIVADGGSWLTSPNILSLQKMLIQKQSKV